MLDNSGLDLPMLAELVTSPACSGDVKQLLVYALVRVSSSSARVQDWHAMEHLCQLQASFAAWHRGGGYLQARGFPCWQRCMTSARARVLRCQAQLS